MNNPLMFNDPSGESFLAVFAIITKVVSAVMGTYLGEGVWRGGHAIEFWGNYNLGKYNAIWQGVLIGGAIKEAPKG